MSSVCLITADHDDIIDLMKYGAAYGLAETSSSSSVHLLHLAVAMQSPALHP